MPTRLTPTDLAGRRILVAGEAILDEYLHGQVVRLSREAPVPIVHNPAQSYRCGGAANAAANVTSLGSTATLVAAAGADPHGELLRQQCTAAGITYEFLQQASTNAKQRIMGAGQQLVRVDRMDNQAHLAGELAAAVIKRLDGHDAVLLSDYGQALLADAALIIQAARQRNIPVVVDPRGRDWTRYAGTTLLKPSAEEFMPDTRLDDPALATRIDALLREHSLGAILLTGGRQGMLLGEAGQPPLHLPTHALDVYDVTGAGDTVAAVMALGLAAQGTPAQAAQLANQAAGVVVSRLGAVPVRAAELTLPPQGRGGTVTTLEGLLAALKLQRQASKSVVMTNGCFDILHAGHLDTLGAAASMGDLLVVAVNDDESVRQLKGRDRPFMPLGERLQLLAGLGCVDYVLPFAGPDATQEVRAVMPDVYVKGGDWEDKAPPEAQAARAAGGRVAFLGFRQQRSTTAIVKAIRQDK